MLKMITGAAIAVSIYAVPAFAQGGKVVDVIVDPQSINANCGTMMKGWENNSSIDQPATIQAGVKNETSNRMIVLTKNKAGQYWSVADLAPGESRRFNVNEGTNFAWAIYGDQHSCVSGFSLANGATNTIK